MKLSSTLVGCALVQLITALAVPIHTRLNVRATAIPPTEDPFYDPPAGLDDVAPGTILRNRSLGELSFGGSVTFQAKAAYQLLYRTTDSLGNASATVTTIIVPNGANFSRVLSYQTAEDSAYLNCAPSYTLQEGSNSSDSGVGTIETLFIIAALDQGWVVNVPDYEGLQSAFTSGIQAGQATLDSVRAFLSSGSLTNISSEAEYQMWGYSGGSLASEWAAELQPSYAPELDFKGMSIGGLTPNVTSVLLTINEGLFAGLIPAGIMGLSSAYPELNAYVNEHLINTTAAEFKQALSQCLLSDAGTFASQNIFSYFDEGEATLFNPIPQTVLAETGQMGTHGTPQMPVYLYKATGDEVSPVADTDEVYTTLCAQGANITYIRDTSGDHATEEITGSGDAFQFLVDRFNGVALTAGCTSTDTVTDLLTGDGLAALGVEVVDALLAILQLPVGDWLLATA